jgi:hypothetical protein
MNLTTAEFGLLCLVLFGLFYWLGIFTAIRAVLAFVGVILIGTAGWIGTFMTSVAAWSERLTGSLTSWAFGVSITWILVLITLVVFLHDLHPKHSASKRTGWAGIALGFLLLTGVAAGLPLLGHIPADVQNGVNNVRTAVGMAGR